jgi:hypothetical protein
MRYMEIHLMREISGQGNSGKRTPGSKYPGEKASGGVFR